MKHNPKPPDPVTGGEPPQPPDPDLAFEERKRLMLHQSATTKDMVVPAALSQIYGSDLLHATGARIYVNTIMEDAGRPTDPIERILIEQLLLAHHRLARLHVRAEGLTNPEHIKVMNAAVTRLKCPSENGN